MTAKETVFNVCEPCLKRDHRSCTNALPGCCEDQQKSNSAMYLVKVMASVGRDLLKGNVDDARARMLKAIAQARLYGIVDDAGA